MIKNVSALTFASFLGLCPLPASAGTVAKADPANTCSAAGAVQPVTPAQRGAIERYRELHPYYAPNKSLRYAMAFANGWGVKADLTRATAFVCHAGQGAAVLKLQIRALGKIASGQKPPPFRYCNYAISQKTVGICDLYAEDRHQKAETVAQQKAARAAGFTAPQIAALDRLQHKARMYVRQQASKEYSRTGEDYAIRLTGMISAGNMTFNRNVRDFIAGTYPDHLVAGIDADALLQKELKKLTENPDATFPQSRTLGKFHDVQAFWQDERDAWLALFSARYPNADPAPFRAQMTFARLHLIRALYDVPARN